MSDPYENILIRLSSRSDRGSYWPCGDGRGTTGLADARGYANMSTVVGSPLKGSKPIKRRSPGTVRNAGHSVESTVYDVAHGFESTLNAHGGTRTIVDFTFMFKTDDPRRFNFDLGSWFNTVVTVGWGDATRPTVAMMIETAFTTGVDRPDWPKPYLYGKPGTGHSAGASLPAAPTLKPYVPYHATYIYHGSGAFELYINGVRSAAPGGTTISFATMQILQNVSSLSGVNGISFRGQIERVMVTQDATSVDNPVIQDKFVNMHKVWLKRKLSNRGM